ncbi:MAG: uracil-DNA glycosylase family protein [Gammaproteobacteria bacterium]
MPHSFLSADQLEILEAMDIGVWCSHHAPPAPNADALPESSADDLPAPSADAPPAEAGDTRVGDMGWEPLTAAVARCSRCRLHASRRQTVFGVGNRHADWMIIGEAPGADEDRQGEPFVGRAGRLLNGMLRAAGFARSDVYIANVLKCRPPSNRNPSSDEAAACADYLRRQIELVSPKLILVVGRIAAQNLLQRDEPVGSLRGTVHRLDPAGVPVIVTYHPAYLLRSPEQKRKAWADLCLARRTAAEQAAT